MSIHPTRASAQDIFEYTRDLRRDFHRHPELGFQETRTAGIVARELGALGLEVLTGIAKTGVVGLLEGAQPGPVVMLRFDMDALPIQEASGVEYASQNPGVMHACGHDGHTAVGLSVARILAAQNHNFAGMVKFVFQPAEEGMGGAEQMISEGVLENPRPDLAIGIHLWNGKPVGWLGIAPGAVMAAAEKFSLRIIGRGGHAALPHLAVDPVLAGAQIITSMQSIVARNISPLQTGVISVGAIQGGDTFNVIPPEVQIQGTIRTFEAEAREKILSRFHQLVEATALAMGCQVEIKMEALTPAVINRPEVAARVAQVAGTVLPDAELDSACKTMASEDMAFFLEEVPGCFIFVGSGNPEKGLDAPHHHPKFDFDEAALVDAVSLVAAVTLDHLAL